MFTVLNKKGHYLLKGKAGPEIDRSDIKLYVLTYDCTLNTKSVNGFKISLIQCNTKLTTTFTVQLRYNFLMRCLCRSQKYFNLYKNMKTSIATETTNQQAYAAIALNLD